MDDTRTTVHGACIPRYVRDGKVIDRERWRSGTLAVSPAGIEHISQNEKVLIPLTQVTAVTPTPVRTPAIEHFDQRVAIHHVDGKTRCITILAFPGFTVRNFPLQLLGMLTGSVRMFIPLKRGASGVAYEEATFSFLVDRFIVRTAKEQRAIPLDAISHIAPFERKDAKGRQYVECVIDYVNGSALDSVTLLGYDRLHFLSPLLQYVHGMRKGNGLSVRPVEPAELPEVVQQVAVMLYTGGMDAAQIEQTLGISSDDLQRAYDALLDHGLAEVVRVRKEVQLNSGGIKAVDEIVKRQIGST